MNRTVTKIFQGCTCTPGEEWAANTLIATVSLFPFKLFLERDLASLSLKIEYPWIDNLNLVWNLRSADFESLTLGPVGYLIKEYYTH